MSNAFTIAAVTAVMRGLLRQRLTAAKSVGIVNANADVTAQPPDRIPVNNGAESRLNLFLYEIWPNTGWANENLPSRDSEGRAVSNPALAIDLYYLLSAYGIEDMEAEILLGHGMQAFHESPGLSRATIKKFLDPAPANTPGSLPKKFREQGVKLADDIERIKISPRYVKSEEMSKIWSSLQAHYRPSVVYQVTVVLIESNKAVRTAPPVLMRGTEDRGPRAQANLLPPFPTLLLVRLPDRQPAAPPDAKIELFGHHLAGSNVVVRFFNERLELEMKADGNALVIGAPDFKPEDFAEDETLRLADTRIEVDLAKAKPVGKWAAGSYSVEVQTVLPGEAAARTSNLLGTAIAPAFATSGANKPIVVKDIINKKVTITLTTTPPIQPKQIVSLILGDQELPAPEITAQISKPVFKGTLPAGMLVTGVSHLARLRVDGVESLFIKRNSKPPAFDDTQRIKMP